MSKKDQNLETTIDRHIGYEPVLPAVFSVKTFYGSGRVIHLGTSEKIPLCGSKLQGAQLTDINVKIDKYGQVYEFWKSDPKIQPSIWVKVSDYDYCKRCLATLNGR